jgi:hypothetical protein
MGGAISAIPMPPLSLEQGLLTLLGTGPILETAREISDLLRAKSIDGAIIGGVAVGLHGRLRATEDVNVLVTSDSAMLGDSLRSAGFAYDESLREFSKRGVPVHIVTRTEVGQRAFRFIDIDGIRTVSLADLINIKLRSGRDNILRARDLGDAVDLIRANQLMGDFTGQIDSDLRSDFRRTTQAIADASA